MTNQNPWELTKGHYLEYVVGTYRPQIEQAIVRRVEKTNSSVEAAIVINDLESVLGYLQEGEVGLAKFLRGKHEKAALAGIPTVSGFTYRADKYLDVFDALHDFYTQTKATNRDLAEALQMSFRGIGELVRGKPPHNVTERRLCSLESQRPNYVARFAHYARLDEGEREHLESLPIIHPEHMRHVYICQPTKEYKIK